MIKIVTDSTAYPTKEEIEQYDLTIVPLYVSSSKGIYKERVDISDEEFYQRLANNEEFGRSQPSTNDFVEAYKPLLEQGHEIVSIHISSELSGTVNSANAAKTMLNTDKITVIDSKSTSVDLLYKVIKAHEFIEKGYSREEIEKEIEAFYPRVHGFFLPINIDLLIKGGRISHFQGTLTSALRLYLILYLNEGRIELFKMVRTQNGAKKELVSIVKDIASKRNGLERIDTIFSANEAEGEEFRQTVEKEFGLPTKKYRIGPVLGTHLGLQSLGIAFITKE